MTRVADALAEARRRLAAAGSDSPGLEARLLLAHGLAAPMADLIGHPERVLPEAAKGAFAGLVARRVAGEPIAYITGRKEFWSLDFEVDRATLIPRPETEVLVETALGLLADRARPWTLLDLGTGSGCILLALLSELPNARGLGVDIAAPAIARARANAGRLGLAERAVWCVGDWGQALQGPFDLVVANPPYIAAGEWAELPRDVAAFEPVPALLAGADGLDAYRRMIPDLPRLLAPEGLAIIEIGATQAAKIAALSRENGLQVVDIKADLAGRPRCVVARAEGPGLGKKKLGTLGLPD